MATCLCLWMSWHLYRPAGAHGIRCSCSRVAQGADVAGVDPRRVAAGDDCRRAANEGHVEADVGVGVHNLG
jgi:hypothetical protein